MHTTHRQPRLRVLGLLLTPLLVATPLAAEPEPVAKEIIDRARSAVLGVQLGFKETGTSFWYCASFIDAKGWAVVPLDALTYHTPPVFWDSKRTVIPFKKVLAMDPELMLAIVELGRRSKTPLKLSEQRPEIGEPFALLWDHGGDRGVRTGPILAHRQLSKHGPGAPHFLSLGMYIGDSTRSAIERGAPVINSRGELLGVYTTTEWAGSSHPKRVLATPVDPIKKLLETARANSKGLSFPLKENNPHDEAYWAYNLSPLTVARNSKEMAPQDQAKANDEMLRHYKALVDKYPNSRWAKDQVLGGIAQVALFKLGVLHAGAGEGGNPPTQQDIAAMFQEVVDAYKVYGDDKDGAGGPPFGVEGMMLGLARETEKLMTLYQKELERWGDSPAPEILGMLANTYEKTGKDEAAAATYKQEIELAPDNLSSLYSYQSLLIRLNRPGDSAEEKRISALIEKLEDAYTPRR